MYEENDTVEAATSLSEGSYDGLTLCPGDRDVYAVTVSAGEQLTAEVAFTHDDGNLNAQLLNPDGELLSRASGVGNTEVVQRVIDLAGTYFVLVEGADNTVGNSYTLTLTLDTPDDPDPPGPTCEGDAFEPNNTVGMAPTLTAGSYNLVQCDSDDDDFLAFDLNAGDTLTATLTFNGSTSDIDAVLLDTDGFTELDGSYSVSGTEEVSHTATADGVVTLHVYALGDTPNPYTLNVTITGGEVDPPDDCDADAFEPNNSPDDAPTVTAGDYSLIQCDSDDDDYLAVELNNGDTLTATIAFSHALSDIDLTLVDTNGTTTLDSSLSTSNSEEVSHTATAAGTYFIRVYALDDTPNPYDLTVTVTEGDPVEPDPTCDGDAFEPNDTFAAAATITAGSYDLVQCDSDDDDFLAVELTAGDTLTATLAFEDDVNDIDVQLLDTDGTTVLDRSTSVLDSEEVSHTAATTGTYFIRVYALGDTPNPYDLTVTVTEGTAPEDICADAYEPNGSSDDAPTVSPGTLTNLGLCPNDDGEDFFALDLLAGDAVTITITFDSGLSDLDLWIYDTNGTSSLDASLGFTGTETVSATVTADGTYFIRTRTYSSGDPTPYTMTITVE